MTVVDGVCPQMTDPDHWDSWIDGGVDIAVPTVANWEDPAETQDLLEQWERWLTGDDRLVAVNEPSDFDRFPVSGKLGVIIHFQNTLPMGDDLANYERFYHQGLADGGRSANNPDKPGGRWVPGTRRDGPLTSFGREVIKEDEPPGHGGRSLPHRGPHHLRRHGEHPRRHRSFSHSNPLALCKNRRNTSTDEQIRAVADLGAWWGINAYPAFLKQGGKGATVSDLVDHIDYLVDLIGPHQVGLGLDFCYLSPEIHAEMIASGEWSIEDYPDDSGTYPIGLETPAQITNITRELVKRGYPSDAMVGILGQNWIDLFKRVWSA